jgi:hypothetical protein
MAKTVSDIIYNEQTAPEKEKVAFNLDDDENGDYKPSGKTPLYCLKGEKVEVYYRTNNQTYIGTIAQSHSPSFTYLVHFADPFFSGLDRWCSSNPKSDHKMIITKVISSLIKLK